MDDDQAAWPTAPGTQPPALPPEGASAVPLAAGRPDLAVAVVDEGRVRIVTVAGEIDHDTGDGLRGALDRPVADGIELILVDLGELRFCDSTGLNILLAARRRAEASGLRLELVGPQRSVERLFVITGADSVLRIHPDLGSALKTPGPTPPSGPTAPDPG
ncbi:STAS domain-containing protein [Kitasatospora sp. NPDC093550]|uniref:STAS domain-containing protein n=1 Tax=Kitasatospora sp. NPDC093550 TaxID=3364089 RepID=UPI0038174A7F